MITINLYLLSFIVLVTSCVLACAFQRKRQLGFLSLVIVTLATIYSLYNVSQMKNDVLSFLKGYNATLATVTNVDASTTTSGTTYFPTFEYEASHRKYSYLVKKGFTDSKQIGPMTIVYYDPKHPREATTELELKRDLNDSQMKTIPAFVILGIALLTSLLHITGHIRIRLFGR